MILIAEVKTTSGIVTVKTKMRRFGFLGQPRTEITGNTASVSRDGIQFLWNTQDDDSLRTMHEGLTRVVKRGMSLQELRTVADLGRHLIEKGKVPFPADTPLPETLRVISPFVKQIV